MLDENVDYERLEADDVLTDTQKFWLGKRIPLLVRAENDEKVQSAIIKACREGSEGMPGYLYFFNYLANIFEPRNPPGMQVLPYVPYEYQIDGTAIIHRACSSGMGVVGRRNIHLDMKSRDMGATWEKLEYFAWDFIFNRASFHIGSFKEEEVDKLGTHVTLFGKLRKIIYTLPPWLRQKLLGDLVDKILLLSYGNDEVSITGESANEGFGRSKRVKAALLDEFQNWENDYAALQSISSTTNTIFIVGTPQGYGNYYSEIARKRKMKGAVIRRMHWSLHPLKAKDVEFLDGKPTSTWYRDQCAKLDPEVIAAELDLSFETSLKGPVFASIYGAGHQKKGMRLIPGLPIIRGWDPGGGHFAVIIMQVDRDRRVHIYKEVLTHGDPLEVTANAVHQATEELIRASVKIQDGNDWQDYFEIRDVGDPSGATISKANQRVPEYEELFAEHGILVDYLQFATMPSEIRVRARIVQISSTMQRHISSQNEHTDGPAFWIDVDGAPTLDEALRGGYRRKLDANKNVLDQIDKRHPYNDVVDAAGYGIVSELGVPEQVKREARRRSEEQKEDEDDDDSSHRNSGRRSRC